MNVVGFGRRFSGTQVEFDRFPICTASEEPAGIIAAVAAAMAAAPSPPPMMDMLSIFDADTPSLRHAMPQLDEYIDAAVEAPISGRRWCMVLVHNAHIHPNTHNPNTQP